MGSPPIKFILVTEWFLLHSTYSYSVEGNITKGDSQYSYLVFFFDDTPDAVDDT